MRKIERQMLQAVNTPGKDMTNANTKVRWSDDQSFVEVLLHNNLIASINWNTNRMAISDAGWQTTTTKSRLNALLGDLANACVYQKKFIWYLCQEGETIELDSGDTHAIEMY